MLKKTLIQKYLKDNIAHFYIMTPPSSADVENQLKDWYEDFILELMKEAKIDKSRDIETLLELGHDDILIIKTENKSYTQKEGEFDNFFNFLKFRSSQLKRKFIFIEDAYKINENLGNKLLKTLEVPPIDVTIFFLNEKKEKLLQTIESRAIKIRLDGNKSYVPKSCISFDLPTYLEKDQDSTAQALRQLVNKGLSLCEFLDKIKKKSISEEKVYKLIIKWVNETNQNVSLTSNILDYLKYSKEQSIYNNSVQTRLTQFLERTILL